MSKATKPVKRRLTRSRNAALKKKKKLPTNPPGYKTCCCGNAECKEAMLNYFRNHHKCHDPAFFFPWLYVELPKMPKANAKSRSKERKLKRDTKILRHKLFLKHLGITKAESRAQVAYPVHFPSALYVVGFFWKY
jgi:hypothetical protein